MGRVVSRAELRKASSRIAGAVRVGLRASANELRHAARDLSSAAREQITGRRTTMAAVAGRLHALSPLATLSRGYAVARAEDGRTLSSIRQFSSSTPFDLVLRDGTVPAVSRGAGEPRENPA